LELWQFRAYGEKRSNLMAKKKPKEKANCKVGGKADVHINEDDS